MPARLYYCLICTYSTYNMRSPHLIPADTPHLKNGISPLSLKYPFCPVWRMKTGFPNYLSVMKFILFASLIVFLSACAGSRPIKPYTYPHPFEFVMTDSPKGNRNYIYIRASQWIVKTFVSPREVIRSSDGESGKLVARYYFTIPQQEKTPSLHVDSVYFTLTLQVDDSRSTCRLSDFSHKGGTTPAGKKTPSLGNLDVENATVGGIDQTNLLHLIKNRTTDQSRELLKKFKFALEVRKDDTRF